MHKGARIRRFAPAGLAVFITFAVSVLATAANDLDATIDCFGRDRGRRIDACTKLLKEPLIPLSRSRALAMRGLGYSLLGQYSKALADYNASLSINPDFSHALNNRAWVYFKLGRPEAGAPDVERALKLSPRSAHAFDTRAHIHQALGRVEEALADYSRAIQFGGARIIKLYQCGLQANGLYSGMMTGVDSGAFRAALATCISDRTCDPLPADEECRKLTS